MRKYQKILLSIIIGLVAFPTITFGSTFVSALIQGKSVPEAVQIMAEQIEALIDRISKVESEQKEQGETILQLQKKNTCLEKETLLQKAKNVSGIIDAELVTINQIVSAVERQVVELKNYNCDCNPDLEKCECANSTLLKQQITLWQSRLDELNLIEEQFLEVENQCSK